MACLACGDKGLLKINWADAPEDYALCLCMVGQMMRSRQNISGRKATDGYPLWMLWCERERVAHDRVVKLEDALTADELHAHGFQKPKASDDAAVIAAGKKR